MTNRRVARGTDNNGLRLGALASGTRLGEFVIEASLGSRGTGQVYKATHLVLPRRATIQVLPAAEGPVRSVALDLLREACIVDAVDHPGMPRIFECGMLPDRRPWIASELIEGVTVAHLLESRRVSINEVIAIVHDVADILAESHRRGLVHCSVAPESIVIPANPRRFPLCLVDWVAARVHDSTAPLPLVVGGRYVAPEQASGTAVDDRSDVYSLGRVARDLLDCATTHDVPPMFVALLDSMIADERSARPASAEVRNTAAWLKTQLAPPAESASVEWDAALPDLESPTAEPGLPDLDTAISDLNAAVPESTTEVRSAPITSELSAVAAGEIHSGAFAAIKPQA
jgi:serine/threonine protein kinase